MVIFANVLEEAFSPLISVFQSILVFIHDNIFVGSWGLAIIGLTVFIRAILMPLTISQIRSMQRMQRHAPELKAIQQKYKDDKQRQQQEIMKFYRENRVNPFASCLPLLLQLPVFISLFYMLRADLKKHICGPRLLEHYNTLHHTTIANVGSLPTKYIENTSCNEVAPHSAKFLFIPDITHSATGVVLIVLLALYVASQLGSSIFMSASADPNQRRLMIALPFLFVLFVFRFPAGLLVYWITTNLWSVGQGYFVRRGSSAPPAPSASPTETSPNGVGRQKPALAGVGGTSTGPGAPPPPPRKKKKRTGRRR